MFRLVRASTSGYTFIELLIALALLGIVVAPLLNLFATGYSFISHAREETTALNLCRTRLEEMRAMGYTAVCVQYLDSSSLPVSEFNPLDLDGFIRETNVTLVKLLANPGSDLAIELLQIDVTVTWQENNRNFEETLSTYLANR
jgi:prepilin-type N-terminal cleavage/methylation domain-containing protein